jgi:hypothetical protein
MNHTLRARDKFHWVYPVIGLLFAVFFAIALVTEVLAIVRNSGDNLVNVTDV